MLTKKTKISQNTHTHNSKDIEMMMIMIYRLFVRCQSPEKFVYKKRFGFFPTYIRWTHINTHYYIQCVIPMILFLFVRYQFVVKKNA